MTTKITLFFLSLKIPPTTFATLKELCTFAIGSGRNPDYNEAFAIISRIAKKPRKLNWV